MKGIIEYYIMKEGGKNKGSKESRIKRTKKGKYGVRLKVESKLGLKK